MSVYVRVGFTFPRDLLYVGKPTGAVCWLILMWSPARLQFELRSALSDQLLYLSGT
jgi:hypothetical protein